MLITILALTFSFVVPPPELPGRTETTAEMLARAKFYVERQDYAQAAVLLRNVSAPGAKQDHEAHQRYQDGRFLLLQCLRKARQYREAEFLLTELEQFDWQHRSTKIKFFQERALLQEDQGNYGRAAVAWKTVLEELRRFAPQWWDEYYTAYFHYVRCMHGYAHGIADPQRKEEYITRVARLIVKVDEQTTEFGPPGLKVKYLRLLEDAALKKAYDGIRASSGAP